MSTPLLQLERVCVEFGALRAVDGVSLSVRAGERRAIIGPNGAGKTTLFNAIAGEQRASSGAVLFAGRNVTRLGTHRRAALGMGRTFQITTLFGGLSVEENVRLAVGGLSPRKYSLFGSGAPAPAEASAVEASLHSSGLEPRRAILTKTLSYGEQRQLELAMALACRPKLLLLDEPAAGLSPAERVHMAHVIRGLSRELTVVLIEHDMDLALGLVDHVTCLHYGQVLVEGSPDEIRGNDLVQEVYLGKPHHA